MMDGQTDGWMDRGLLLVIAKLTHMCAPLLLKTRGASRRWKLRTQPGSPLGTVTSGPGHLPMETYPLGTKGGGVLTDTPKAPQSPPTSTDLH